MAEVPFFSSQGSQYEQHQILLDQQENIPSSPPAASVSRKPRKPPPITPKRFTKFFTPRNTKSDARRAGQESKAGRQLRDITRNAVNRRRGLGPLEDDGSLLQSKDEDLLASSRPNKRRKYSIGLDSSPPQSSPLKHVSFIPVEVFEDEPEDDEDLLGALQPLPTPIRRIRDNDAGSRLLQRGFGGYDGLSRGRRGHDHCTGKSFQGFLPVVMQERACLTLLQSMSTRADSC